jgi:hypothetical protein
MILNPAILALLIGSLLTAMMMVYASWYGIQILRSWDMGSGSEQQLSLERRTYLISTIVSYTMAFQLLSLFLFIYTADHLHSRFTGAMCAAGTLNADPFGYPLLVLKIFNFLLAGLWLIVNHADASGYDYPLIRFKYGFLLLMTPLLLLEAFSLFQYFLLLHADIITSCCGSLFSTEKSSLGGDLSALPAGMMTVWFFTVMALTLVAGGYFRLSGKGGYLFAGASTLSFLVSIASLISFICLYYYELPSHHCPFCVLQREYGFVGYFLYLSLLCGGVSGMGTGILMAFRRRRSLVRVVPAIQRRLADVAMVSYGIFSLLVIYKMIFSPLRLA